MNNLHKIKPQLTDYQIMYIWYLMNQDHVLPKNIRIHNDIVEHYYEGQWDTYMGKYGNDDYIERVWHTHGSRRDIPIPERSA